MDENKSSGLFVVFRPLMSAQQSSINRSITLIVGNRLISRQTNKDSPVHGHLRQSGGLSLFSYFVKKSDWLRSRELM